MPGSSTVLRGNNLFSQTLYIAAVAVPATVAASTTTNNTLALSGVRIGDILDWNQQSTVAGLSVAAMYASAKDVVTIQWNNSTATPISGTAAQPFLIQITRPENAVDGGIAILPKAII
jgi:hypothetical protein